MGLMHRIDLFASSIYRTRIDEELYNKSELYDIIKRNFLLSPERLSPDINYPESSFHTYHNNFNNVKFEKLNLEKLIPLYDTEIKKFLNNLSIKVPYKYSYEIVNINVGKDGWMERHKHLDPENKCQYVFTHYLSFDNLNHPATIFYNNNNHCQNMYCSKIYRDFLDNIPEHSIHHVNWSLDTYENDMFIFPAYLEHGVLPKRCNSDKLRILVAGNIKIELNKQ